MYACYIRIYYKFAYIQRLNLILFYTIIGVYIIGKYSKEITRDVQNIQVIRIFFSSRR